VLNAKFAITKIAEKPSLFAREMPLAPHKSEEPMV
jgi:hypothetical protein